MKYFSSFPTTYTLDNSGNLIQLTNLLQRVEILPSLLDNPLLFYQYSIQEGDTPDSIANKYYGDPYRYWLIFLANNIIDPEWSWPLTSQEFNDYLNSKYGEISNGNVYSYVSSTVYQYQKIITTTDSITGNTTVNTLIVDENTYNNTQNSTTINNFPDGSYVTQTITTYPLSILEYETQVNENKRNINLISVNYVSQFESQFQQLMSS